MSNPIHYVCEACGKKLTLMKDEPCPECCNKIMKPAEPLPVCEIAPSAEHFRLNDDSDPCDDSR